MDGWATVNYRKAITFARTATGDASVTFVGQSHDSVGNSQFFRWAISREAVTLMSQELGSCNRSFHHKWNRKFIWFWFRASLVASLLEKNIWYGTSYPNLVKCDFHICPMTEWLRMRDWLRLRHKAWTLLGRREWLARQPTWLNMHTNFHHRNNNKSLRREQIRRTDELIYQPTHATSGKRRGRREALCISQSIEARMIDWRWMYRMLNLCGQMKMSRSHSYAIRRINCD